MRPLPPRRRAVAGRALVAGAVLAALAGSCAGVASCGIPTNGPPDAIPSADVPYGLTSMSPSAPAVTSPPPRSSEPRVYLVGPDEALVPRGRQLTGDTLRTRLVQLLADLADGPSSGERQQGLTTALPPNVHLTVTDVQGGTATVDIAEKAQGPSGTAGRRAVAQIVLSATSLPGVHAVLLTHDGAPLDAPLPSGRLTSDPLTAPDYEDLVTSRPT